MVNVVKRPNGALPIASRIAHPTPEEVRLARLQADLTQTQAAQLVSTARGQPYRTWQAYEVETSQAGHRTIPLATWELFLLLTDQHPTHRLARRRSVHDTGKQVLRKKGKLE